MSFITNITEKITNVEWLSTIIELTIIMVCIIAVSAAVDHFLQQLLDRFEKTEDPWDDAFIHAIKLPARSLIWLVGLTLLIDVVDRDFKLALVDITYYIRTVGLVTIIAWGCLRFIEMLEDHYTKHKRQADDANTSRLDRTTMGAVVKLLRFAVYICTLLLLLQTMGVSISGVLAFAGASGLGLSFAAKDLLANFFGAIMIYLDRPFKVGDWIRSPDKEIEGTVEIIGWRSTQIRTFDKRPLYVPNSVFTTISVENPARMSHRRFYENIRLRYADIEHVKKIVTDIKAMLASHPAIDEKQTLFVNLNQFGESCLHLMVYAFTHDTDWVTFQMLKQHLLLKIYEIIKANNSEIALPTSTVRFSAAAAEEDVAIEPNPSAGGELAFGKAWLNNIDND